VAATQFAPAAIGGLYWRARQPPGAIAGILLGFCNLVLYPDGPFFVRSGWMESEILERGLFGLSILRPTGALRPDGLRPVEPRLVLDHVFQSRRLIFSMFTCEAG
jgi:phosphoserine phosphatase RsbU/P